MAAKMARFGKVLASPKFGTGWFTDNVELIVRPIIFSWGHFQKKVKEGLLR
jgi:hypothetical protein